MRYGIVDGLYGIREGHEAHLGASAYRDRADDTLLFAAEVAIPSEGSDHTDADKRGELPRETKIG